MVIKADAMGTGAQGLMFERPRDVIPLQYGDPVRIGRYRITGRLGAGGMGVVYLGQDEYSRPVAVKVIRDHLAADPEFRARFADEVSAARRVAPFCTAQVLDADTAAPLPYLVTEYIDGVRLDDVVTSRGPLQLSMLQGVAVGVASALTSIHGAGIVHRDLKPSNVLLSYSGPRVIDFGIARALDAVAAHTRSGLVLGSAGWMAPEHMEGGVVGPPADVYAWGLLVAYAAVGRHPFGDGAPLEVAQRMVMQSPSLEGVPTDLRPLVAAALARDPGARPRAEQLVLLLLGDRAGGRTDTRTAVTQVLDSTWPDGRQLGPHGGKGPAPTRIGPPTRVSARDGHTRLAPSDDSADRRRARDDNGPGPAAWSGRSDRGGRSVHRDAAGGGGGGSASPDARAVPDGRVPPGPAPVAGRGDRVRPAAPYERPPRTPRRPLRLPRRPRIPGKRLIILLLLIFLAMSAIDQLARIWDENRGRLWEQAWTWVEEGFREEVIDRFQRDVVDRVRNSVGDVEAPGDAEVPGEVPSLQR